MNFDIPEHLSQNLGERTHNMWHTVYPYPEEVSEDIHAYIVNDIARKQELSAAGLYQNLTEIIRNTRWHPNTNQPFTLGIFHGTDTFAIGAQDQGTYFLQPEIAQSWKQRESINIDDLTDNINLTPEQGGNGFGKMILQHDALAIDVDTDNRIFYWVCNPEARDIYSGNQLLDSPSKDVHKYIRTFTEFL